MSKKNIGGRKLGYRWKKVGVIGGKKLGYRWKEVGVEVENKKNFPLLFSSVILILEVLNMAKKLKYQLTKNTFVDNDIVRYSDAFKNLNASQINLFLFLCCLAKQQYDVEKDDETEGKKLDGQMK